MITGDIKETAQSIGKSIGIVNDQTVDKRSFTGGEFFEKMNADQQNKIIQDFLTNPGGMIFARTEPKHKRQLVQLLSKNVALFFKPLSLNVSLGTNRRYDW